jgi:anion-transporting  ArsA/GET3 family ATPase
MNFSGKKIVFVTGKGGVGKSFTAAAIAYREAKRGQRVCLAELGSQSFFNSFFETSGIGYEPVEILQNLHVSLLTPEESLREYVLYYIKVGKLYDLFFNNRVTRAFFNACPGVNEVSILGKLTSGIRGVGPKVEYDLFVVDCFSTGHALALFRAPGAIAKAVSMGPLGEQTRDMTKILRDPSLVAYVVVTLAEEMPVNETLELSQALKDEFNAEIDTVVNRLILPPVSDGELRDLLQSRGAGQGFQDFLKYLAFKTERQKYTHDLLRAKVGEVFGIPLIFSQAQHSLSAEERMERAAQNLEKPWALMN